MDMLYPLGGLGVEIYSFINRSIYNYRRRGGDKAATIRKYRKIYGTTPNLANPQTLNEKILWLKLNDHSDLHTQCADKYTVREYLSQKFGNEFLVPLLYHTTNPEDITMDVIPDFPCIIKASHSQGDMKIIRNKEDIDIKKFQFKMKIWLKRNLYIETQEWQYKNIKPRIIVEKLLLDKEGHIPNDYKLHFINGQLAFVYCSVGRETVNKRNIYDANWNPLYFTWVEPQKDTVNLRGEEIVPPKSFEKMKEIGSEIAKDFPYYVRVDFYDVDGVLYFGEITFHHGSGLDVFKPSHYDTDYGKLLALPQR